MFITSKKIQELAKEYGIDIIEMGDKEVEETGMGHDYFIDSSNVIGGQVSIGFYKDQEKKIISIFHEIGHTLIRYPEFFNSIKDGRTCKTGEEALAWLLGIKEAHKHGFNFSDKTLEWATRNILTYTTNNMNDFLHMEKRKWQSHQI